MNPRLDICANRNAVKWSRAEQAGRILWALARPSFRLSPRPLWGWRRFLLRVFGARIGRQVHIYPSVRITIPWNIDIGDYSAVGDRAILYALGTIRIGDRATISQGAHICAGSHDWRDATMPLAKEPITICSDAWICADAFVGPGVTVGCWSIVGARAAALRDIADNTIAIGNPAQVVSRRFETSERR